tara:strand:+ start:351 stop:626 length:276 start_codon:yes stop_codon:yes gene_type:complete
MNIRKNNMAPRYNMGGMAPQGQAPQGGGQGPDINQLLEFLATYDPNAPVGQLLQELGMAPAEGMGGGAPQGGPQGGMPPQGNGGMASMMGM